MISQTVREMIANPLWGVFTLFVGASIVHFLTGSREMRAARRANAADFRKAFEQERRLFSPPRKGSFIVYEVLRGAHSRHEFAISEMRTHLPWYQRSRFERSLTRFSAARAKLNRFGHKPGKHEMDELYQAIMELLRYARP